MNFKKVSIIKIYTCECMSFFFPSYGNNTSYNEAGIYKRKYNSAGNDDIRISERLYFQRRAIIHAWILFWTPFHAINEPQISFLMDRHEHKS